MNTTRHLASEQPSQPVDVAADSRAGATGGTAAVQAARSGATPGGKLCKR
jgi:hypothetical protein